LQFKNTTLQKCAVVPRRARIRGSRDFVSISSRRESDTGDEQKLPARPALPQCSRRGLAGGLLWSPPLRWSSPARLPRSGMHAQMIAVLTSRDACSDDCRVDIHQGLSRGWVSALITYNDRGKLVLRAERHVGETWALCSPRISVLLHNLLKGRGYPLEARPFTPAGITCRHRARREQLQRFYGLSPESQVRTPDLTVFCAELTRERDAQDTRRLTEAVRGLPTKMVCTQSTLSTRKKLVCSQVRGIFGRCRRHSEGMHHSRGVAFGRKRRGKLVPFASGRSSAGS